MQYIEIYKIHDSFSTPDEVIPLSSTACPDMGYPVTNLGHPVIPRPNIIIIFSFFFIIEEVKKDLYGKA